MPDSAVPVSGQSRPHGIPWRLAGVVLVFVGIVLFAALVSYDWHDVSAQCAPPQSPPKNLAGYGGAWFAYAAYLVLGFAAWAIPPWFAYAGQRMARGRGLGWSPLGMAFFTVAFAALAAQLGSAVPSLAGGMGLAGSNSLNNAGLVGGLVGDRLALKVLTPAIGAGATCCLMLALLVFGVGLVAGLRAVLRNVFQERAQRAQRQGGVAVDEADRDKAAERAEKEAAAAATADDKLAKLSAREAARQAREEARRKREEEREAARIAREEERERKAQEREAEKAAREREREEKALAKQREAEEREAAKVAEEEERRAEMERRTQEFLARQREEEAKREAAAAAATAAAAERESGIPASRDPGIPAPPEPEPAEEEAPPPPVEYTLPTVDYLAAPPPKVEFDQSETEECGRKIVETLGEFGITVSLVGVHRGPVITQYHLMPAPGVRINKVVGFNKEIQRALCAQQVRILAPIPGKGVIGVEVPNAKADIVAIREIAEGETWRARVAKSALPLLLGKDIGGADYTADLASMPHLLIAGATGAGKSACMNSLLTGLLLTRKPSELRLIMVDPKYVEFTPYADIPHLVVPIITEPKKVGIALQWAVGEMNRRLKLFAKGGARNIADYNKNPIQGELFPNSPVDADGKLPYIVVVIDELADLMLTARAEIEGRISNLAAKARAAGIHMIIATQRPSVNVVTGVIKANFPGRIAFKVSSPVDSRTILDVQGAENLIGRGDMLVHDPRIMGNTRVQGCWVSDAEVKAVTDDLRAQGRPVYVSSIQKRLDAVQEEAEDDDGFGDDGFGSEGDASGGGGGADFGGGAADLPPPDPNDEEALLRRALELFRDNHRASTSFLQRKLGLGYNRAARVLEKLQERGYIGPPSPNNGPREILVDLDEVLGDGGDEA